MRNPAAAVSREHLGQQQPDRAGPPVPGKKVGHFFFLVRNTEAQRENRLFLSKVLAASSVTSKRNKT